MSKEGAEVEVPEFMDKKTTDRHLSATVDPMSTDRPMCARCAADPQPANFLHPRACAFPYGDFTTGNWACATMSALLALAIKHGTRVAYGDELLRVLPVPEAGPFTGFLVLQTYKYRGRIQGAAFFDTAIGGTPRLTYYLADRVIAAFAEDEKGNGQ